MLPSASSSSPSAQRKRAQNATMNTLPASSQRGRQEKVRFIEIDRNALKLQAVEEEVHAEELQRARGATSSFWGKSLEWKGFAWSSDEPTSSQRALQPRRRRRSRTTSEDPRTAPSFASNVIVSSKYNAWNFAPRVLLAQIQRPSNMYFLFIAVLQTIKEVSNTSGVPTILLPLTIVFICSAIKEALEDRERHRADHVTNSRAVLAFSALGVWESRQWGDIRVGDIVKVLAGETIPADLFMLSAEEQDDGFSVDEDGVDEDGEETKTDASEDSGMLEREDEDLFVHASPVSPRDSARRGGNLAYIETKSLDGETNLKIRSAIPVVAALTGHEADLLKLRGVVECEPPNNRINSFEGKFSVFLSPEQAQKVGLVGKKAASGLLSEHPVLQMVARADDSVGVQLPITAKQMILRSCVLRNTRSVTGLVVFTGHETKVFCSNTEPVVKSSSVEKRLNGLIIGVVMIQQVVCFVGALLGALWMISKGDLHWYLKTHVHKSEAWNDGVSFPYEELLKLHLRYFIIMQNFVPISLNVSLEFVKYWQAYFMEQDLEMYDAASDTPAMVRSSALNEDLGRVHHIFTDKTGTLTMNLMLFRFCMIGDKPYGGDLRTDEMEAATAFPDSPDEPTRFVDFDATEMFADLHAGGTQAARIQLFLKHLALCHTLIPAKPFAEMCSATAPEYSASSPDEQALVSAAAFCNVRFVHRTPTTMTLLEPGSEASPSVYKIRNLLEFDSDRKRMTVIVESPSGAIVLMCKGADNVIFERLAVSHGQADVVERVYNQLSTYAKGGMRTLCLAYKKIDRATYDEWNDRFQRASSSMEELVKRRQGLANAIDPLMNEIEQDLELLGVTAVQDKLQAGVPKTLELLQETNMKVWTLTGDKMETAVNIGYACNLLSNNMVVKQLSCEDYVSTLKALQEVLVWHTQAQALAQSKSVRSTSAASLPLRKRRATKRRRAAAPQTTSFLQSFLNWFTINGPPSRKATRSSSRHKSRGRSVGGSAARGVHDSDGDVEEDDADEYGLLLGSANSATAVFDGQLRRSAPALALVIDGTTLECALRPRLRALLYDVTKVCKSVICCRVSPKQKSDVVELVRRFEPESITLAIGDGANDVGMIQAAHVGVGISGQEGTQAVNSSDYAIAQFRFLQRLLFVHGRWAYRRVAKLMSYMLYKNVTYVLTTFWFGCRCGFSGQPLIIDIAAQSFNVLYTSLPLVLFAVFDQDVSSESASQFPYLYSLGQKDVLLRRRVFWPWILNGIWHSIVIFFVSSWAFEGLIAPTVLAADGKSDGLVTLGFVVFTSLVIVVNVKLCLETFLVTWHFVITVGVSVVLWFVVGNLIAHPQSRVVQGIGEMTYVQQIPSFWLLCGLVVTLSLLRDVIWKMVRRLTFPSTYHILQEREKLHMRNSPRSLMREQSEQQQMLWNTDVQAVTAKPSVVEYTKLLRPFEDERDSFRRSSPLAESLMGSSDFVGGVVRARGPSNAGSNSSWQEEEMLDMVAGSSMEEQPASERLPALSIPETRRSYYQYHGYAFSEDENVDSDVEAASTMPTPPPSTLLRKPSSQSIGSGGDLFDASYGGSASAASPLRGSRTAIKKIFKSVRGQKNA